MLPLRFQLSCGKSVKYRLIEFFVFDYGSLPYIVSLFFWSGVTFPLVALDKITIVCFIPSIYFSDFFYVNNRLWFEIRR